MLNCLLVSSLQLFGIDCRVTIAGVRLEHYKESLPVAGRHFGNLILGFCDMAILNLGVMTQDFII